MINEGNLDDENQSLNGQPRISGSASSLPMQVFPWRLVMPSLDTPVSAFSAQSNFEALLMALNAVSESASKSASESKDQTSLDTISKNKVYLAYLWASALGRFPKKDSKDVIGGGFQALFRDRGFSPVGSWVGIASFSSSSTGDTANNEAQPLPKEFVRESASDFILPPPSASSTTLSSNSSSLDTATATHTVNAVPPPPLPQRATSRVVASLTTVLHARVELLMPVPSSLIFNENAPFQSSPMHTGLISDVSSSSVGRQFGSSAAKSVSPQLPQLPFQSLLSSVHFAAVSRVLS
jgi:hypothetical protein